MAYRSLYLKYRPQTFESVAGQQSIVRTLKNSLMTGKMAHAYLFAGPRGTGKTTMARLFAKALDCEEGLGKQCCHCSNCLEIAEGRHPDVIEIDAASNNGVDQVRDLIDKVKYAPLKAKYKVYIIDEVHMMSTGAFNALLKTLEEPPENVIFILCTTEPYKVIPTILSRCQRFDFSKVGEADMKKKLIEVLGEEGATYEENGLNAVIALADGGMRDALSIIEQVLSYSGNTLKEKDVLTLYGITSKDEKISLIEDVVNGNVSSLVKRAESYITGGVDIRRLTGDLIEILKDLLVYEKTKDASLLRKLTLEEATRLSKSLDDSRILTMVMGLVKAQNDYRNVSDVRSLFELELLSLASSFSKEGAVIPTVAVPKEEPIKTPGVKAEAPSPVEVKIQKPAPVIEEPKTVDVPKPKEEPIAPVPERKVEEPVKPVEETPKETKASEPANTSKFEAPPDFLFDDEEKKPEPVTTPAPKKEAPVEVKPSIDSNKIFRPMIATDGEKNEITDDEIVKIMVLGDKAERTELYHKWPGFENLRGDPKLGNLATLLAEGHPYCLCKEALILSYDFTRLRDKANIKANQEPLQEMVEQLLGRRVFIYAIDPNERHRITNTFFSLQQVNKLPEKDSIVLELPK